MSEQNSTQDGDVDPQHSLYMLILLVLVFFAMGLLGLFICHILKKKGYRCRTFRDELDSENKKSLTQLQDDEDEELNEDTVEKIVKCIIQNEANVEVLKEMLAEGDVDLPLPVPVPSGLCPHRSSQDGGLPHHHTVHLGSTQAPCMHCSRKKTHPLHHQGRSKECKGKMHPGEITVFSVGRFRVTHIWKKLDSHGSQEESLPDSKQDLGSADVDLSNEKLQSEGSQNGIVPIDGLQQGRFQETDSLSKRKPKEDCADESTQGESPLIGAANSDVSMNGPEKKGSPKASSLQKAGLLVPATSYKFQTNCSAGPKSLWSEDLEEMERLNKKVDPSANGCIQKAADEVSENKGSQVLQIGSRLDLSGNYINRTSNTELQEHCSVVQDPGVSV